MDYYVPNNKLNIDVLLNDIAPTQIPKTFQSKNEYKSFVNTILELDDIRVETGFSKYEMLENLMNKMFETQIIDPLAIDLIVLVDERESNERNIGQQLQLMFGLDNAFILNFSGNHCANMEVVLHMVARFKSADVNNVLVLNSTIIDDVNDRIIGTYGILGDAAGLLLLGTENAIVNIVDTVVINNGNLFKADVEEDNSLIHSKYILRCIKNLLIKSKLSVDEIDKLIIQNANPLLYSYILTNAGLDVDKIYSNNFGKYGHLDCLDFLINLCDLNRSNELNENDKIVSIGMGWAGSYVAILFTKTLIS